MKKEIQSILEEYIKKHGLSMTKKVQEATYGGFFGGDRAALYDERKASSLEEIDKLNNEGFRIAEDPGVFLLNCFIE